MTAALAETPQLDYAPRVPWRRTRRARLLLGLLSVFALAAAAVWSYPRVRDQWQVLTWQERCMAAPVPPGTVVYDTYWGDYSSVGGVPFAWSSLYAAISPPVLPVRTLSMRLPHARQTISPSRSA